MKTVLMFLLGAALCPGTYAQVKTDAGQRYLVLEVARTGTLEKELNDAAQQGFRLKMATAAGNKVEAIMERDTSSTERFEYVVVATHSKKNSEKEMNEAAEKGFRIVPRTFMN